MKKAFDYAVKVGNTTVPVKKIAVSNKDKTAKRFAGYAKKLKEK